MSYYLRVLSTSPDCVPLDSLRSDLEDHVLVEEPSRQPGRWENLLLTHADGGEIAVIERNPVVTDSLASEEIDEFAAEIRDCMPASAADWLLQYFQRVRCIYALQILSEVERDGGWDCVRAIQSTIWNFAPSILQADNEGFTNEEGYHILWQFRDSVDGAWWMGVLQAGTWMHFQMDLSNIQHRKAFLQGTIPDGVIPR
jgi:hypothetical protein